MDRNIRIAKELVKLAKSLVAIDEEGDGSGFQVMHDVNTVLPEHEIVKRAICEGNYNNFTGEVNCGGLNGKVRNAIFSIGNTMRHIEGTSFSAFDCFLDGVWEDGDFVRGLWNNGTWENGYFEDSTWVDGIWLDGYWKNSIWHNGTWNYGNWESGEWKRGTWKDGVWKNGIWHGGTWKSGEWFGGKWFGGKDENGKFHPAGDSPDKWGK